MKEPSYDLTNFSVTPFEWRYLNDADDWERERRRVRNDQEFGNLHEKRHDAADANLNDVVHAFLERRKSESEFGCHHPRT